MAHEDSYSIPYEEWGSRGPNWANICGWVAVLALLYVLFWPH
jgi:hypothetical protein